MAKRRSATAAETRRAIAKGGAAVRDSRDPRDFAVLAWVRDEGEMPVYRVVKDRIKAASTAAVLARKVLKGR